MTWDQAIEEIDKMDKTGTWCLANFTKERIYEVLNRQKEKYPEIELSHFEVRDVTRCITLESDLIITGSKSAIEGLGYYRILKIFADDSEELTLSWKGLVVYIGPDFWHEILQNEKAGVLNTPEYMARVFAYKNQTLVDAENRRRQIKMRLKAGF